MTLFLNFISQKLLEFNPSKRISARDALQHQYFQDPAGSGTSSSTRSVTMAASAEPNIVAIVTRTESSTTSDASASDIEANVSTASESNTSVTSSSDDHNTSTESRTSASR